LFEYTCCYALHYKQLVQARFEHLEARSRAQSDLHAGSVDRLEETNRQMRDMRRALQDIAHEKVPVIFVKRLLTVTAALCEYVLAVCVRYCQFSQCFMLCSTCSVSHVLLHDWLMPDFASTLAYTGNSSVPAASLFSRL
jgi:hypothetical protein